MANSLLDTMNSNNTRRLVSFKMTQIKLLYNSAASLLIADFDRFSFSAAIFIDVFYVRSIMSIAANSFVLHLHVSVVGPWLVVVHRPILKEIQKP